MNKTILVIGATGQQGGAVAKHLHQKGYKVRALTRDLSKPQAQDLAQQGMEVVAGDIGNKEELLEVMRGVDGVYSVQNFWVVGFDEEVRQGKLVVDAVKELGIPQLVFSSVGGAERNTGIPHFDSKWVVEQYAREMGVPMTVFRPVFFMENFLNFSPPRKNDDGTMTLSLPLKPETSLQIVAVDDIGAFVSLAFDHPEHYIGKDYELAGDDLTPVAMAEAISKQTSIQTSFESIPMEVIRGQSMESAVMYEWFEQHGYEADIAALKQIYPGLMSFEEWLKKNWKK